MKSLLVTTELFNIGGLETHVAGEVACLAEEGFRIHLVVGPNTSDKMLPKEATSVTTGLVMGPAMTTAELIQTVESLRKIIRAQGVECVHAHPFMSLVPSQIAAELEGIPFVVTLHGPASLSDCYGPLYDFLLASVILPKADMVVAVSQEVADLAAPYVDDARLCVLPNGVPVGIFGADLVEDCADGRWLLVSRLDIHKVVGIRDFIQKAAAAGLPGVLIVGDGDARGKLLSQLDVDGLSNYVEFLGARTDVAKLMQRAAGVAGMGRVILEGLACSKPAVLVGYDGVKGVVTPDVFRVASATNFSGRKMPTISATEFSRQLSMTQRGTNELTDLVMSEYNDKAVWRKFAQKLGGLKTHGRSLLSDAYIKFASETNAPVEAYLHSHAWFEQVGRLAHSLKHFDQSVIANFDYAQKRYMDDRMVMQIASLNQAVVERDGQIASLNQAVVERDGQLSDLNRVVDERGAQLLHLSDTAKHHYDQLTSLMASRSWKITRPMRIVARFIRYGGLTDSDRGKLYNHARRIYQRFPVAYETKLVLRKYFLKITGWTPSTAIIGNSGNPVRVASAVTVVPSVAGGAVLKISESVARHGLTLQPQAANSRVPYFGVRRQEGSRRVAILTNQLLDWNDGRPRFGGGERYALELARLLKELSFDVTFYQPSFQAPGEGEYYGFKVVLLRTADSIGEFHHGLCSEFTELTKDFDHVYYHLPEYASGKVREDGLMTCHGIWFDHNNYPGSIFRTPEWFQQLYSAFSSPRCVVSVDTNSMGVIRSLWPELASKMRFIPNFYDATAYYPRTELRNKKRLTILFPRRSQINRGSRIFGEIVSLIPHDVEIIWLGEGDPVDTQIVKDVCKADKRATFAVADFDQMPQWYQKADIAVIPTIACEGTSLSCLEALAAGCAVVSTNVGGLPDLVYDGMNGLLVDPDARSIAAAINRLIVDSQLRERLQRSASETAHHFELKSWRERWVGVLNEYGWVSDGAIESWRVNHGDRGHFETRHSDRWLILTRNAIHGGVESLIREEAKGLNAPIVVCGGHDRKDTCQFEYTRADNPRVLTSVITEYDIILYHWLPEWCLDVLRSSGKRCIEFVHRTDTAESDKTVPTALVTHSAFLARYIYENTGRSCRVVDHPIAIDRFKPQSQKGKFVGAITSYYDTKGIDIFLEAWAEIKNQFPNYAVRFYGAGDDLPKFRELAIELGLDVDFRDATREPWEAMKDFACFVVPSRIEGLPVAILEALAMNIPVVASDLPGMVEFNQLSEARGYSSFVHLARNEDPQDFAAVMSRILEHGIEQNSSAYINAYYSPEKHCADLIGIYKELCH